MQKQERLRQLRKYDCDKGTSINFQGEIHICRILKQEDRSLKPKYGRGLDCMQISESIYKSSGVIIADFEKDCN